MNQLQLEQLAIGYIGHLLIARCLKRAGQGIDEIQMGFVYGLERDFISDIQQWHNASYASPLSDDNAESIRQCAMAILNMSI